MGEQGGVRAWFAGRRALGPLLLFLLVCAVEAALHRDEHWLLWYGLGDRTHLNEGYYLSAFHYHNDADDEPLHAEGAWLGEVAFAIAARQPHELGGGASADRFRLLAPFGASFALPYLSLSASYRLVNLAVWLATCWATWSLAWAVWGCARTALTAGLLTATSFALVILTNDPKAAMCQLAGPWCLIALAVHLEHFSSETSPAAARDSCLLGLAAGLATFGSVASFFFLPFLGLYGALEQPWRVFLRRGAAFALGFVTVVAPILLMTQSPGGGSDLAQHVRTGLEWAPWWAAWRDKMLHHFPLLVPWHLWLGLLALPALPPRWRRLLACTLTSLLTTEGLMLTTTYPYYNWTIGYYYLHFLFPLYLLLARVLAGALFPAAERPAWQRALARTAGCVLVMLTLLSSNLALLGNRYFYSTFARRAPPRLLLHGWLYYDNLALRGGEAEVNQERPR